MKRPTLEEVKKHFENAKEIICLQDRQIVDITENVKREIHSYDDDYWVDYKESSEINSALLYSESRGGIYAEILTYKEKTFSLTADQLRSITDPQVKKWFPEVFETVLEVGKWYADRKFGLLICIEEILKNGLEAYGFGSTGEWYKGLYCTSLGKGLKYTKDLEIATEPEVFEALKNEAVKRGFVEGAYFKGMDNGDFLKVQGDFLIIPEDEKHSLFGKTVFEVGSKDIFRDGIWTEIIPAKTKYEAEKELNCKIVD